MAKKPPVGWYRGPDGQLYPLPPHMGGSPSPGSGPPPQQPTQPAPGYLPAPGSAAPQPQPAAVYGAGPPRKPKDQGLEGFLRSIPAWGWALIGVGGFLLLVLFVVAVATAPQDEEDVASEDTTTTEQSTTTEQETTTTAEPTTTTTAAPTTTTDPNSPEAIAAAVQGRMDDLVDGEVISIDVFPDGWIEVQWRISGTGSLLQAQQDATDIIRETRDEEVPYAGVRLIGREILIDELGGEIDAVVVRGTYPKALIDQITFSNFNPDNVFEIADDPFVHQALL